MYLLDTDVCLDFAFARSDLLRHRVRAQNGRGMGISSITLAELRYGARRPGADLDDEQKVDLFASVLTTHPFDADAAETYGTFGTGLAVHRKGFDRLIAAHALTLNLTLVTRNTRNFGDVPGLRVEDWTR